MSTRNRIRVDVAIVGGGIAGLWLLNLLNTRGYSAVLIERASFGDGQTICSQGMIHGGFKYALGGSLTAASEALAAMPARWRDCLMGSGEVDLRGVRVLSEQYHVWSPNESVLGRIGGFIASKAMRSRVRRLERSVFPSPFNEPKFTGAVYELDELVIDTSSLLGHLASAQRRHTVRGDVDHDRLVRDSDGSLASIRLPGYDIRASLYVLTAGAGNGSLIEGLWPDGPTMQRRPLNQLILRSARLPPLFAHCVPHLSGEEPRLTITSHLDANGDLLWYIGGQLGTDGVGRSDDNHIREARAELAACLPWIDLSHARLETLRVDRAEPHQHGGQRPDTAFVEKIANVLVCWPTKLTLVPDLGDRVLALLPPPSIPWTGVDDDDTPTVATPPWNR